MDFNTILMRFGLNPEDFENKELDVIQIYKDIKKIPLVNYGQ